MAAVAFAGEEVEVPVVVPGVASFLPTGAEVEFGFLPCLGLWIELRGGEQHFLAARAKKGASGFANARRDTVAVAGFEVQEVNLVERVARLAFALKNQGLSFGRKITFTAAPAFESELANVRQKLRFTR